MRAALSSGAVIATFILAIAKIVKIERVLNDGGFPLYEGRTL